MATPLFLRLLMVIGVLIIGSTCRESAAGDLQGATLNLEIAIANLQDALQDSAKEMRLVGSELASQSNILGKYLSRITSDSSEQYAPIIYYYAAVLNAASNSLSTDGQLEKLEFVLDDITVKTQYFSLQFGATPSVRGLVKVTVDTERQGQIVSGYTISCNPRKDGERLPAMYVFNNPTSPTTRFLPPGHYVLVIRKNNEWVTTWLADIGLAGEDFVPLRIEIPQ